MQYLAIILGLCLFTSAGYIISLVSKAEKLETQLLIAEQSLKNQNQAIEKLKLDSEKYACDRESLNEYTKAKYSSVMSEHELDSCELKLKEFEKALGIYDLEGAK